jgi:hypothetical protein
VRGPDQLDGPNPMRFVFQSEARQDIAFHLHPVRAARSLVGLTPSLESVIFLHGRGMLAALVRSLPSLLIQRVLVGAAGLVLLALAFLASLMVHEPRVFTLSVPVAGGLILAQGVGSTAWLAGRRPGRPSSPPWVVWGQAAAALICWLVLVWIFWLRA